MSTSSDKGVSLENFIAKTLQRKLGARVARDRRSGAESHQKLDITDYYQDTPFDNKAKNHKTVSIKDWMRQAKAGASLNRVPTVAFKADDDVLACLPFDALVDLAAEIEQLRREITDLRTPVVEEGTVDGLAKLILAVDQTVPHRLCRNGHILSPSSNKCLAKKCPYSSTYKKPKAKK